MGRVELAAADGAEFSSAHFSPGFAEFAVGEVEERGRERGE